MKKIILIILLILAPLFGSYIDTNKNAITVADVKTLVEAQSITKKLSKYETYVSKIQSKKRTHFIIYAVNILNEDRHQNLTDIKKIFKDAYEVSTKVLNFISLKNTKNDLFDQNNIKSQLEANNNTKTIKETWINPNKQAILLSYEKNIEKAKDLATNYKNNDLYIYNTIKNGDSCHAVYIVNIEDSDIKFLLNVISSNNHIASKVSNMRVKYFAKNISPESLFIQSNSKLNTKIVVNTPMDTIKGNIKKQKLEILTQNESWINPKKKAILLNYVKNPDEAKKLASKYSTNDIYIYNTIKKNDFCCAVYIVNIRNDKLYPLLKKVIKAMPMAEIISTSRIKYFARDISPTNLFIEASSNINNPKVNVVHDINIPETKVSDKLSIDSTKDNIFLSKPIKLQNKIVETAHVKETIVLKKKIDKDVSIDKNIVINKNNIYQTIPVFISNTLIGIKNKIYSTINNFQKLFTSVYDSFSVRIKNPIKETVISNKFSTNTEQIYTYKQMLEFSNDANLLYILDSKTTTINTVQHKITTSDTYALNYI